MKCPFCLSTETKVVDKREAENELITRRRRECLRCQKRFTTYERAEAVNLIVLKRNKNKEAFDREKLKKGIAKACEKRLSDEKINQITTKIETELAQKGGEVKSSLIGQLVLRKLKKLDKVAYLRFASVYRNFTELLDFEQELTKLTKPKKDNENT